MIEQQKVLTTDEIEEARERLRVEKVEFDKESFRCGEKEGRAWALTADYNELIRLEYWREKESRSENNSWIGLVLIVDEIFWNGMLEGFEGWNQIVDEESLAHGFVEGATKLWQSIKP